MQLTPGTTQQPPDFEYFVYYDGKVGTYGIPMLSVNRFDLVREIERLFRDPSQAQNKLLTNAEDFSVFKIGEYTKRDGHITPCQSEHICNLHDIRTAVMRTVNAPQQDQMALLPT